MRERQFPKINCSCTAFESYQSPNNNPKYWNNVERFFKIASYRTWARRNKHTHTHTPPPPTNQENSAGKQEISHLQQMIDLVLPQAIQWPKAFMVKYLWTISQNCTKYPQLSNTDLAECECFWICLGTGISSVPFYIKSKPIGLKLYDQLQYCSPMPTPYV